MRNQEPREDDAVALGLGSFIAIGVVAGLAAKALRDY